MANLCCRQQWNLLRSWCDVSNIFVWLEPNLEFLDRSSQKPPVSNFTEIRAVGGEQMYAGWQTDITKLTYSCRRYVNAPKNCTWEDVRYLCVCSTSKIVLKRSDYPHLSSVQLCWDAEENYANVTDLITPTLPHQRSNDCMCLSDLVLSFTMWFAIFYSILYGVTIHWEMPLILCYNWNIWFTME